MTTTHHLALTALAIGTASLLAPAATAQTIPARDVPTSGEIEQQDSQWVRVLRSEEQHRLRQAQLVRLHELAVERGDEARALEIEKLMDHMDRRHTMRLEFWSDRVGEPWREHLGRIAREHVEQHQKLREKMIRSRGGRVEGDPEGGPDAPADGKEARSMRRDRFVQKQEDRRERLMDGREDRDEWTSDTWQERHDHLLEKWQLDGSRARDAMPPDAQGTTVSTGDRRTARGFRLSSRAEARKQAAETINAGNEQRIYRQLKQEVARDM